MLSNFIDESHCLGKQRFMSFPSGHTGIAFALAIALYMEMNYSKDPKFFEIKIKQKKYRNLIYLICLLDQCFRMISGAIHPLTEDYYINTPPGVISNIPILIYLFVMFYLSLKGKPQND